MTTATTTVSKDFTIELPPEVRAALNVQPGEQVGFLRVGKSIRIVRARSLDDLRGTLRGDWSDYRDEEDEPR